MIKKIGLIVISVIAAVSIVGAASAQDAQTPPVDQQDERQALRQDGEPILRELLQIVAEDLSLEPQDILQQMRGQTLADVIAAQNGDITQITADVVAALTERINQAVTNGRLTQEQADEIVGNLSENVESALNGELRGALIDRFGGVRPGLGGQRPNRGEQVRPSMLNRDVRPLLNAVQDALGLTGQEIAEELRGGSTLGEIIAANSGDAAAIVDAAIATATERLDAVREAGTLTQEQEDAMISGLRAFYEAVLNGAFLSQADTAAQGSV